MDIAQMLAWWVVRITEIFCVLSQPSITRPGRHCGGCTCHQQQLFTYLLQTGHLRRTNATRCFTNSRPCAQAATTIAQRTKRRPPKTAGSPSISFSIRRPRKTAPNLAKKTRARNQTRAGSRHLLFSPAVLAAVAWSWSDGCRRAQLKIFATWTASPTASTRPTTCLLWRSFSCVLDSTGGVPCVVGACGSCFTW